MEQPKFWYATEQIATCLPLKIMPCNICSKDTYYLYTCQECLPTYRGLKIAPSNIPQAGNGVFATKSFKENKIVCEYGDSNNILSLGQSTAYMLYGGIGVQPYTYTSGNTMYDAANVRTIGSMINDSRGTTYNYNCEFKPMRTKSGEKKLVVKSTKPIKKGQELYIDYGEEYWEYLHQCQYATSVDMPEWYRDHLVD